MSKTSERLDNYITQMQEQADQHSIILASDIVVMLEQLKDDLQDDKDNLVKELENTFPIPPYPTAFSNGRDFGIKMAVEIVKRGGVK